MFRNIIILFNFFTLPIATQLKGACAEAASFPPHLPFPLLAYEGCVCGCGFNKSYSLQYLGGSNESIAVQVTQQQMLQCKATSSSGSFQ